MENFFEWRAASSSSKAFVIIDIIVRAMQQVIDKIRLIALFLALLANVYLYCILYAEKVLKRKELTLDVRTFIFIFRV